MNEIVFQIVTLGTNEQYYSAFENVIFDRIHTTQFKIGHNIVKILNWNNSVKFKLPGIIII